jgi:hypothetical protein
MHPLRRTNPLATMYAQESQLYYWDWQKTGREDREDREIVICYNCQKDSRTVGERDQRRVAHVEVEPVACATYCTVWTGKGPFPSVTVAIPPFPGSNIKKQLSRPLEISA